MKKIDRPEQGEFGEYYGFFIKKVISEDILPFLEKQADDFVKLIGNLKEDRLNHSYEEGKWSVKELLGHLTDVERIFAYRILAISRGDKVMLPGYDPDSYVREGSYTNRNASEICKEYLAMRKSNLLMFDSLTPEMLTEKGNVNGATLSARAIIFLIGGHQKHHESVLREKYLKA